MNPKHLPVLFSLLLLLGAGSAAVAQTCPDPPTSPPDKVFPAKPTAGFTHIASVTGSWNAPGTWNTGTVPGNGAVVCIPAGLQVTVNSQETSRLRYVQVNGTLRMWIHSSTRLFLDTLYIASGATFVIGDSVNTVKAGAVAEIVFISWDGNAINRTWDVKEKTRGLFSDGTVRLYGEPKAHMVGVTADVLKNATTLTADAATPPANWKVGDKLVLTGSYFRQVATPTSSQDEKVTITSISGNVIGFTPALVHDHARPKTDLRLHVANLTRNVVLRSESAAEEMRGHVMLVNSTVDLRHVALENLGRTDKSVPLDDFIVTKTVDNYTITARADNLINNRRGRYALHFHKNGIVPGSPAPSKVHNSVVNGTTGWAFVNHSSHVDFLNNVAYDFAGAGFVTELGDELGNFDNNIAIRGTGNGEYRNNRVVFANASRPQPLSDFAFGGDGFWFQGSAVRARNNVASGCDGAGMIWFTTGAPDVEQLFTDTGGYSHVRYSHFPKSALNTVYSGFSPLPTARYWDH
ncbi:MAG TPA: G8 domain-containing protein, partial [Thermoanaerobaculia bacterium]